MAITFQAGRNTSPAQADLMTRLVAESPKVATLIDAISASMTEGKTRPIRTWTPREVRSLIDLMITTSNTDAARVETKITPNRYAGSCADCGANVEAEAGRIRKENGRWITRHPDGQCPPKVEVAEPAARIEGSAEGFWTLDGEHYKVLVAVHGSGRLYVKILDRETGTWAIHHARTRGILRRIESGEAARMTKDEAGTLGKLYGRCIACSSVLTDETSIEIGMGPVCRSKFA